MKAHTWAAMFPRARWLNNEAYILHEDLTVENLCDVVVLFSVLYAFWPGPIRVRVSV